MAVYRVNKNRGYTVMANYHLRDKTLSLKAVGLLSKMLSFNDGWQFSTKGLSAICKEGPDAVLAALRELEDHGYLIRHRQRDAKGRMSNTVFEIYEQPQPVSPHRENPDVDNPDMDNPHMENPHGENPAQLNTNQVINNQRNNSLNKYQSINLDGMDRMDEREQYRELIRDIIPSRVLCAAATANAPLPGESSEMRADISISVPTQHMTAIRIVRLVKDTARHGLRTLLTKRLGKCSHWLKRKLSKNTRSASAGNLPSQNARMQSVICRNSTNSSRQ